MKHRAFNIMVAAVALLSMAVVTVAPAEARRWNAGVNQRQRWQQQRLQQGLQSGQLTGREYGRLENKEGRLAAQEHRMRKNGLQPWERNKLEREQNRLSGDIYKQKHDNQYVH